MMPELQSKLVEILSQIQTAVAATTNFALEQLPDVVMQFILYSRVVETVYFVAPLILIVIAMKIGFYFAHINKHRDLFDRWFMMGTMATPIVLCLLVFLSRVDSFVMVWLAPKVYLLAKLAELIR